MTKRKVGKWSVPAAELSAPEGVSARTPEEGFAMRPIRETGVAF